jgi:hypothetical protein
MFEPIIESLTGPRIAHPTAEIIASVCVWSAPTKRSIGSLSVAASLWDLTAINAARAAQLAKAMYSITRCCSPSSGSNTQVLDRAGGPEVLKQETSYSPHIEAC